MIKERKSEKTREELKKEESTTDKHDYRDNVKKEKSTEEEGGYTTVTHKRRSDILGTKQGSDITNTKLTGIEKRLDTYWTYKLWYDSISP